jgi:hypothetical protein
MGLNVRIQPDAEKAAQLLAAEKTEIENEHKSKQIVRNEMDMGKLKMWVPDNYDKDRHLSSNERKSLDAVQGILTLKSEIREDKCWMHTLGCTHDASVWVHEVGFDLKEMKARLDFAQASSADMTGATPGFCNFHMAEGPAMLAQAVYQNNILVQWGYLPKRWFVKFTDGTSQRGPIKQINPTMAQPMVSEEQVPAGR